MDKQKVIFICSLILVVTAVVTLAATRQQSPIEAAKLSKERIEDIRQEAHKIGLACGTFTSNRAKCISLTARAEKNPALKAVFLKAKAADVNITIGTINPFSVGSVEDDGYISINPSFNDEKIIAYLNGE